MISFVHRDNLKFRLNPINLVDKEPSPLYETFPTISSKEKPKEQQSSLLAALLYSGTYSSMSQLCDGLRLQHDSKFMPVRRL